jgi:hypothetical protein
MKTLQGVGASASDIPLRRLPAIRKRMQETGMDEVGLGLSDLREAVKRMSGLRGQNGGGQIRMTFPCHVTIRLRSGGILETEGRERGASGTPLAEQQQVVSEKFDAVREAADMPRAWRRRPTPAAS